MHLARLRLRDFRNYARLDTEFAPGFHLLLGGNAQGKTNILESIYLLATLRSFRGVGGAQMVRHGQKAYFAGAHVVGQAEHAVKMYWSVSERSLSLDGRPVRKLSEYLGTLRAVVFCTEDLQLVKGTGRVRRRFLDLLLVQTQPGYLALLQDYARALRSRNVLLKQRPVDEIALESFSRELVRLGRKSSGSARNWCPASRPWRNRQPDAWPGRTRNSSWPTSRGSRATLPWTWPAPPSASGPGKRPWWDPHRDDLQLLLNDRSAAQFASEGQKRTLAIALKMAQAEFLQAAHGSPPVLLIDDVMGELDINRRSGLLPLLEGAHHARGQVFMTCTEENWPRELGRDLVRWHVEQGRLERLPGPD